MSTHIRRDGEGYGEKERGWRCAHTHAAPRIYRTFHPPISSLSSPPFETRINTRVSRAETGKSGEKQSSPAAVRSSLLPRNQQQEEKRRQRGQHATARRGGTRKAGASPHRPWYLCRELRQGVDAIFEDLVGLRPIKVRQDIRRRLWRPTLAILRYDDVVDVRYDDAVLVVVAF
jgi:hypothetical protein